MVKSIPAGMQTDLNSSVTKHCYCWKLVRVDTTVMGFTDCDRDVVFDSVTFKAATGLNASAVSQSSDLSVDDMETLGALDSAAITEKDLQDGKYDNAYIELYLVDIATPSKRLLLFAGNLGNITRSKVQFKSEVRSLSHYLNQSRGQVYQKTCNVNLFSTPCGVNPADAFMTMGPVAVTAVFSRRIFVLNHVDILARPTNWFTNGMLTWNTGPNAGVSSEIKSHIKQVGDTEVWIDMWEAMPNDIVIGNTVTLKAGCNKTIETCKAKFNNVANFRGFPRLPGQDVVTQFVSDRDNNDGTSWYQ